MKKLLLSVTLFIGSLSMAQVENITENFNSFSTPDWSNQGGLSGKFPQNGWDGSSYPGTYISGTVEEKFVQVYAGWSMPLTPKYVFPPKITAPKGKKWIEFKVKAANGSGTVQLGYITNTTDPDHTFTSFYPAKDITSTQQTFKLLVPENSSDLQLAFKFTFGDIHHAFELDDVSYTPLSVFSENFEGFDANLSGQGGKYAALPANGWSSNEEYPRASIAQSADATSNSAQLYSYMSTTPIYLVSPEITVPDGTTSIKFNLTGSRGTIKVGTLTNPTDYASFTVVGDPITITSSTTGGLVAIPAGKAKYIAFQFTPASPHTVAVLDDIVYDKTQNLSTYSISPKSSVVKLVLTNNSEIQFVGNTDVKFVKIYTSNGNLVINSKVIQNKVSIHTLNIGLYFVVTENVDGTATKAKFVKN